jgi:hypothetical protein
MDKALQTAVVKYSLSWDLELAINLVIWIILLTFNCFKDPIILSLSLHWRQMHKSWQALRLSKYVEETGFAELTDGHWEVFVVDCSHLAYHSDSVEVRHPALMEVLPAVSELAMLAVAKMRALSQTHSPVHKYPKVELSIGDWQITGLTNKHGYSFLYWNKSGQDCNPLLSFQFDRHNSNFQDYSHHIASANYLLQFADHICQRRLKNIAMLCHPPNMVLIWSLDLTCSLPLVLLLFSLQMSPKLNGKGWPKIKVFTFRISSL